jgi:hypothetical protein
MARRRSGNDHEIRLNAPVIDSRFHDVNPVAKLNRQTLWDAGVIACDIASRPAGASGAGRPMRLRRARYARC